LADLYAVMGNPIAHSKSPAIHRLFAKQTGNDIHYQAILVDTENFPEAIHSFIEKGGKGLNITVPFKQSAFEMADNLSEEARLAGAVNTLSINTDGTLRGDNTDGSGLITDLANNLGIKLSAMRILILGAGGAVRGILLPLIQQEPHSITIVNRTVQRAEELALAFHDHFSISACGYENLAGQTYGLIINATSASLTGKLPPLANNILADSGYCYDLAYADKPTSFVKWGLNQNARIATDGLGMLVEQAAESFYIWYGVRPDTKNVIASLR